MKDITIICHILTSLNGKINGPFMSEFQTKALSKEYGKIRDVFKPEALLYGTQTMKDFVGSISKTKLINNSPVENNCIHFDPDLPFIISIDPEGELGFRQCTLKRGNQNYQIIEVLSEKVSNAYKNYLKQLGISYITAGKNELNPKLCIEKIKEKFPIKTILLSGGGKINWTFLENGLIDKLSLVISPVVDNKKDTPSVFDSITQDNLSSYSFQLKKLERLPHSGVYLLYEKNNTNNTNTSTSFNRM